MSYYVYLTNQQAQDYLALKLAQEELKEEHKQLRRDLGIFGVPVVDCSEIPLKLALLQLEYIVEEAMWDWLETCP